MAGEFYIALRSLFIMLALACSSLAPAFAQEHEALIDTPVKDKWAVVIGISSFANPKINLKYAAKDAEDFRNFLVEKCHFASDHIKLLTNERATKDKILDVLGDSWLPRVTLPDDLVVIFFSSHGSPSDMDVCGVNYVVAYDTNPDKLFTTGIPIQHLANTIKERVHSNRVLIILDACHSGGASDTKGIVRSGNIDASQIAQGTGHVVICSSAKSEVSWESKKYPNGVFTHTLMEALTSKGETTKLADAFKFLKDNVQKEVVTERGVVQTPVLEASKWKGQELVLAAVPTDPRKVLLEPDELPVQESHDTSPRPTIATTTGTISSNSQANASIQPSTKPISQNRIPDISGDFIGTNGLLYRYWQRGRTCGWEMPAIGEVGKCSISTDGLTLASSWSGPVTGSGIATLECDAEGRVVKITGDGCILTRVGSDATKAVASSIPSVSGNWLSSRGIKYKIWQSGYSFGWKLPRYNEIGVGTISDDGVAVTCSWSGSLAGHCNARLEFDGAGRVVRLVSDNGVTMTRLD